MANSLFYKFILIILSVAFSRPVFAADKNMTEFEDSTFQNACERLLDADLSGYYVATNVAQNFSQFIQLKRLGHTSAYVVSSAKLELPASGVRELTAERTDEGWMLGDPHSPESRVNVMTVVREGQKIEFRFENINLPFGMSYNGNPSEDKVAVQGDILNPNQWILRFSSVFDTEMIFTRVKLDRAFEHTVSQSTKSLLASRLEQSSGGPADYIVTIELKKPLMPDEAIPLLGTSFIYPMDVVSGSNGPFYRYAVPKNVYELLASLSLWTRHWEIAHIDVVHARMLNQDLLRSILERATPAAPLRPAVTGSLPRESQEALENLHNLAHNLGAPASPSATAVSETPRTAATDASEPSNGRQSASRRRPNLTRDERASDEPAQNSTAESRDDGDDPSGSTQSH